MYEGPHVRKGARVGANSTLLPGVTIGVSAVVRAGAMVTRDIPNFMVAVGCQLSSRKRPLLNIGGSGRSDSRA